jgi:hypothetical protein
MITGPWFTFTPTGCVMVFAPRLTPPVKVLAPSSCSRPTPVLVREPVPETTPASVRVTLADTPRKLAVPATVTGPARVRSPAAPALPPPMLKLALIRFTGLYSVASAPWNWDGPELVLPFCKTPPVRLIGPRPSGPLTFVPLTPIMSLLFTCSWPLVPVVATLVPPE